MTIKHSHPFEKFKKVMDNLLTELLFLYKLFLMYIYKMDIVLGHMKSLKIDHLHWKALEVIWEDMPHRKSAMDLIPGLTWTGS